MASSLSELRRSSTSTLQKLKEISQSASSSPSGKDDRFWSPTFDKEKGRGSAIIRFMPAPKGEDFPWVKMYNHGFKGPTGKWYIENSLSTLGSREDPVGLMNSRLWNSGIESDKEVARAMKRKTSYYANVLVVKDPANPSAEGNVFLYRFGQKIYDMIQNAMFPEDDDLGDAVQINPFDMWEGSNFVIKMVGVTIGKDIVPNYDKSYFDSSSCISDDDNALDRMWEKCHSLQEIVAPSKFKTPDELKKRLYEVLGSSVGSGIPTVEGWGDAPSNTAAPRARQEAAPVNTSRVTDDDVPQANSDDDDALLAQLKSML